MFFCNAHFNDISPRIGIGRGNNDGCGISYADSIANLAAECAAQFRDAIVDALQIITDRGESMRTTIPKVFISYSWAQNKERVLGLADRLLPDGVEVVIDEYDFKKSRWIDPIGGVEMVE